MFIQKSRTFFAFLLLSCLPASFFGGGVPLPAPSAERMTPTVRAVRSALPWVVSIGTTQQIIQVNDPFSLFFTDFFRRPNRVLTKFSPLGSGVLIDESGLVVTNYHVVRRASSIDVQLWDGTAAKAEVLGYDILSDLCLLRLTGDFSGLTPAAFAEVDDLFLGETVIAIGNPFGLGQSVSTGVLSALNRSFQEGDVYFEDLLQTDAAINPGNSGGPLVNLDGRLVGINQAIRADAQGIGFAIPLSHIEPFLSYWLKPSHFSDAYLGVDPAGNFAQSEDGVGVLLPEVLAGSPLEKAGFKTGGRVVSLNGRSVGNSVDVGRVIWKLHSGDVLKVGTPDGVVEVVIEPMPDELLVRTRLGLELSELTASMRAAMGLRPDQKGMIVSDMLEEPEGGVQGGQWRQVVRRGDIVLKFADKEYPTVKDIADSLRGNRAGEYQYAVFYAASVKVPVEVPRLQLN